MFYFILKRISYGLLVLLGVLLIVFFLFTVLPGDPARMMLGQRADQASVDMIKKDLGLDRPVSIQFLAYLNDLSPLSIHNSSDSNGFWFPHKEKYTNSVRLLQLGDKQILLKAPYLRRSYQSKRKVTEILSDAFPKTAILAIASLSFALLLGIFLGCVAALKKNSLLDKILFLVSTLGMSLPSFFAAILIAWFFAFVLGSFTGLSMYGSLYSVDDLGRGEYLDLKNLILPALTLGIRPLAVMMELTKSSMLDVLSQDYIRTARAKGLSQIKIIWKHGLKNALNPVVSSASSWFASLMAGAVFVEYVFDWKGLGSVIIEALEKYDFPLIMGSLLLISLMLIFINLITDILYALIDPRIRQNTF